MRVLFQEMRCGESGHGGVVDRVAEPRTAGQKRELRVDNFSERTYQLKQLTLWRHRADGE